MAIENNIRNQKGQILIESLFLALVIAGLLILFSKVIDYQRRYIKKHHFSKQWVEADDDKRSFLFITK